MKTNILIAVCCLVAWNTSINPSFGQNSEASADPRGYETEMDLPATFHRYYGQRVNNWRDNNRKIAKLDMDVDMNYDGTISNSDPADNGAFENTPPGLQLGVGEMTKALVRVRPYRIDFRGEVVITLEVAGVNRAVKSGRFSSFDEEVASTGRIRVWKDASRTELILDSGDPERRYFEWIADDEKYPANLPGIYPRMFFVEGVSSAGGGGKGESGQTGYPGDIRLLITISHREKGAERDNFVESQKKFLKSFRTSFDHILFTVRPNPVEKEFINANAEGVWMRVSDSGK